MKVSIYIPSKKGSIKFNNTFAVKKTVIFLAETYGGATEQKVNGYWKSGGKLETEKINIVYSFADKVNKNELVKYCQDLKTELGQESILLEIGQKVLFI
jgi:hypothetical protein